MTHFITFSQTNSAHHKPPPLVENTKYLKILNPPPSSVILSANIKSFNYKRMKRSHEWVSIEAEEFSKHFG